MKLAMQLFLCLLVSFLVQPAAGAANSWEMTIDSSPVKKYLDYPGSTMKDLVKLTVTCRQFDNYSLSHTYETLYYSKSIPVGLNKHTALAMAPGAVGIIRVNTRSGSDILDGEGDAIANGAGRLFLDLYSNQCAVYHVVVPADCFDTIVAAFYRNGFHQPTVSDNQGVVLNLISDPSGQFQALAF